MSKIYIKFDLPEEQDEFNLVNNASKLFLALSDIEQELRKYWKYGHEFKNADDAVESIRDMFYDILGEHNLDLSEM